MWLLPFLNVSSDTAVCVNSLGGGGGGVPPTGGGGGGVLPYLGMVGRFCGDNPRFGDFQSVFGSLFHTSTQSDWPPLSAEKIGLSLSHLVPEILGTKVDVIVHQNVLFNRS